MQIWELWVKLYLGQNEGGSLGDSTSDSSKKPLQRGGGGGGGGERSVYEWFWWRGNTYSQAHIFSQKFSPSLVMLLLVRRNTRHHEGFGAFLDMRRYKNWDHKISSWKYLAEDLSCQLFPHFCSQPWTLLGGCWRSAATAAHDLIIVEVDGKCPWQVSICSWHCPCDGTLLNFFLLLKFSNFFTRSMYYFYTWKNNKVYIKMKVIKVNKLRTCKMPLSKLRGV